jgi:hypothetical protein
MSKQAASSARAPPATASSGSAAAAAAAAADSPPLASSLCFFALGDFGVRCQNIELLAAAMDKYAREVSAPDFILGLGDNFYPVRKIDFVFYLFFPCHCMLFLYS